ncbi:MAG: sigma-54 dependent transcriptional regulator [Pseudomonadota bacterium]
MSVPARSITPPDAPPAPSVRKGFADTLSLAAVLVIDDEPGMRNFLQKLLSGVCRKVDVTEGTQKASRLLDENAYDVIVLDNIMPGKTGLDWLAEQREIGLFSDAILITAHADLDTAIQAIRAGASDFLLKPFRSNQVLNAIDNSMERARLKRQNSVLRHELEAGKDITNHGDALLGTSEQIQTVRQDIERSASSQAHVVIRGEVGSGKQVAARMLHAVSPRSEKPFIWLRCAGMTEQSFQQRLFGQLDTHSEGAEDEGILRSAAGGSLFLEDVEMLSPECQNILVELLSTGRFTPLGARRSVELDVRIISSTTRSLTDIADEQAFRTDLFYLLTVVEIVLPPLRERADDILELTTFFSNVLATRIGGTVPKFSALARRRFLSHDWPGNVMELRNTVERALIRGDFDKALGPNDAKFEVESLAAMEKRHILTVLEACNGNRAEAARQLGVARKTIDRKCVSWGV